MGTDLLALGVVLIVVGTVLFYKMKALIAEHPTGRDGEVSSARKRSTITLAVGALLTAGSIPANLAASSAPEAPPDPNAGVGARSSYVPADSASSEPSANPSPSASASPSPSSEPAPPATVPASHPPSAVPRKPPPVRKR